MAALVRQIASQLRSVVTGVFNRDHGSFVMATAFAQLLPLLSAPVVMRLYSPRAFGIYAVYVAFSTIVGAAASLALHNAILIEHDEAAALQAGLLSIAASILVGVVVFAGLTLAPPGWLNWAFGAEARPLLPWACLAVSLSGILLTIYAWFVRESGYPQLAYSKFAHGVTIVTVQIAAGASGYDSASGLVAANLLGFGVAIAFLAPGFRDAFRRGSPAISWRSAAAHVRRHMRLPLFTVPATFLNSLGSQLPELLINKSFGAAMLGQYSLGNRIVSQPLAFVATSVQDIFRQRVSDEFRATGQCRSSFKQFFMFQSLIALLLIPIAAVAPFAFAILFGQEWTQAGHLVQAVVFLLMMRFVSSPLSYVWIIRGKQSLDMWWQAGLVAIVAGAFVGTDLLLPGVGLMGTLIVYSVLGGAWYALCLFLSYRFSE